MRRALPPFALLGLLAVPSTARPCDYIPQFGHGYPTATDRVAVNAQGFVQIPFMGRSPMQAELMHPEAFAPIPVDTRSLGENNVELLFETPLDGVTYDAEVWLTDLPDVRWRTSFTVGPLRDVAPPPGTTAEFSMYEGPSNSCESAGNYVQAFTRVVTDDDVLLYELVELQPNDGQIIWAATWATPEEPVAQIYVTGNVGTGAIDGRCFFVRTVDRTGQRSEPSNMHCFGPTSIDAGLPPPPDSGVIDAGTTPDAGTAPDAGPAPDSGSAAPDAGSGLQLSAGDDGCGCSSTNSEPATAAASLGLLLSVALLRRRRR